MDKTDTYKMVLERIVEVSSENYENVAEMDRTLINSGYVNGMAELALRLGHLLDGGKEDE